MNYRKIFFAIIISAVFLLSFNIVSIGATTAAKAMTSTEIQALIQQLQAQIVQLQKQLAEKQEPAVSWCYDFEDYLKIGDQGSEVKALHIALEKSGFSIEEDPSSFGIHMASAVVGFQEKYKKDVLDPWGLEHGTGYVGKTTREKLNALYGCNYTKVLFPNGGEEWERGTKQKISWKTSYPANEVIIFAHPAKSVRGEPFYFSWNIDSDQYSQDGSDPSKRSWIWQNVGYDRKNRRIPDGDYAVIVYNVDNHKRAESNGTIKIVTSSSTTSNPCFDSDGGNNYDRKGYVSYGGEKFLDKCLDKNTLMEYYCNEYSDKPEKNGFSCLYGCKDGACKEAENPITLISPNGGEKLIIGETYEITWKADGIDKIHIDYTKPGETGPVISNLSASAGKYSWTIPSSFEAGEYKLYLRESRYNYDIFDLSDNYFSIVAEETSLSTDCDRKTHANGGPWLFQSEGYWLDMDISTPAIKTAKTPQAYSGIENSLTVSPGQKVTIKAIIDFEGYTACPGCIMYQRVFGSWDTDKVLGDFYGKSLRKKDVTFTAPTEPGEYKLHFNWRADYVPPPEYCDQNMVETTLIVKEAATSTTPESMTVLYPNGGEQLTEGQTYNIKWKATGFEKAAIYVIDYSCSSEVAKIITIDTQADQGVYSWTIPSDFFESMTDTNCITHHGWKSGDNFKIFTAEIKPNGTLGAQDESNNYFSITESEEEVADGDIIARLYGGKYSDNFEDVYVYGDYIYAVGVERSGTDLAGLIVKFNKSNLSVVARKIYDGSNDYDTFRDVYVDENHVYVVGDTSSEGLGRKNNLIIKFNKDLSVAARKVYGGNSDDLLYYLDGDTDHIYALGHTKSAGGSQDNALILKFNKSDLSLDYEKTYSKFNSESFHDAVIDGDHLYVTGYTMSEGMGAYDGLILKFNKSDLTIDDGKVYGGTGQDLCTDVVIDENYVYMIGRTNSEGAGNYDGLIVKFNKSNLSISERMTYGKTYHDMLADAVIDEDHLYAFGYLTSTNETTGNDALMIKVNKSDLNLVSQKAYGGSDTDMFMGAYLDGDYIYAVGAESSEGQGLNDAFILRIPTSIGSGTMVTSPTGFVYRDVDLSTSTSALTLTNSELTLANAYLALANSTQTITDSTKTISSLYRIDEKIVNSDISARLDQAVCGNFYLLSDEPGEIGKTYYADLDGTSDDLYTDIYGADCCPGSSYWGEIYKDEVRKGPWTVERKKIDENNYRILIRGQSEADCRCESSGYIKGEVIVNPKNWEISTIIKDRIDADTLRGKETYCDIDKETGVISFASAGGCTSCCACRDSGLVDIEVIVTRK